MRRIGILVVGLLVLSATPAQAEPPDVVSRETCSAGATSRLELTDMGVGGPIRVRLEVHGSPVSHEWRITLRHRVVFFDHPPRVFFRGTRVANDNGVLAATRRTSDEAGLRLFLAKAVDTQTGQVCRVEGSV